MLRTEVRRVSYYITFCGGMCRGKWVNSYMKWKENNNA